MKLFQVPLKEHIDVGQTEADALFFTQVDSASAWIRQNSTDSTRKVSVGEEIPFTRAGWSWLLVSVDPQRHKVQIGLRASPKEATSK